MLRERIGFSHDRRYSYWLDADRLGNQRSAARIGWRCFMQRESYLAKSGATMYRPVVSEDELRAHLWSDNLGWCLACGTETDGVEPDARRYRCDACEQFRVYGLEELLMMNLVTITEGAAK